MNQGNGRVAMVTGANGTIGLAICEQLAAQGFAVVMACRNQERAQRAAAAVRGAVVGAEVRTEIVDVSRKRDVLALGKRWQGRLDVLVNNAAAAPPTRTEAPEGIELQLATNVLGYLWMVDALAPHLEGSAAARVVNVASYWAGDLDLDDLQFRRRVYHNDTAYRQSKQADRMLTVAWARRWSAARITVNACHPGDAHSTLSHALGYGGHESAAQAADTPVWLASDATVDGVTGKYFAHRQLRPCEFADDLAAIARLERLCAAF